MNSRTTIGNLVHKMHLTDRAHSSVPSIVMPRTAAVIPTACNIGMDYLTTATSTSTVIRVEDVISMIRKKLGWPTAKVMLRVSQYWIYANVPTSASGFTPNFSVTHYDPITASQGMSEDVRGSLTEPARNHHVLQEADRRHLFAWDDTTDTSATLCVISTTSVQELSVIVNVSAYIGPGNTVENIIVPLRDMQGHGAKEVSEE